MRRFLLISLFLCLLVSLESREQPFILGEIESIDITSREGSVILYNQVSPPDLRDLIVFSEAGEKIGSFNWTRHRLSPAGIVLSGMFSSESTIYSGLKIGFFRMDHVQPNLPDKVNRIAEKSSVMIARKDGATLVLIPSGPFVLGKDDAGSLGRSYYTRAVNDDRTMVDEVAGKKRTHYLELKSYYIDMYEISVDQFSRFLNETGAAPPPNWSWTMDPELPVEFSSYHQAEEYCKWAGRRLPTELEWEKAARGPGLERFRKADETDSYARNDRDYPFPGGFDKQRCVTAESNYGKPLPVKSLSDKSFYGIYGMCGNVAEWTSSWLLPYRGNTWNKAGNTMLNPDGTEAGYGRRFKVIRGGSYYLPAKWARSFERMAGGIPTLDRDFRAGFRCAKDS